MNRILTITTIAILCLTILPISWASQNQAARNKIALNLFPKIIAVDSELGNKLTDDNQVTLLFAFGTDNNAANILLQKARKDITNINGYAVQFKLVSSSNLSNFLSTNVAGIFLAEELNKKSFNTFSSFARQEGAILFSPFQGDVERGATAGLWIGARIKPYFNIKTLKASGINLHPTLLRISKRYE